MLIARQCAVIFRFCEKHQNIDFYIADEIFLQKSERTDTMYRKHFDEEMHFVAQNQILIIQIKMLPFFFIFSGLT